MNVTDATLKNGRYELPRHARGVLVLAEPPEAGWRVESDSNQSRDPNGHPPDEDCGAFRHEACERTATLGTRNE